MKQINILSAVFLLFSASQLNGSNNRIPKANAQTEKVIIAKNEVFKKVKLKISGMTCAGCSSHVTQVLENVEGVVEVNLQYPGDVAIIEYDSKKTSVEKFIAAVEGINYKAEEVKEDTKKESE